MRYLQRIFGLLTLVLLLTSCNQNVLLKCPDAEIEWIDLIMINDIKYQHHYLVEPENISVEKGNPIGEVKFKMADKACSNHQTKNGDAAFLDIGTVIYEIKGYPTTLIVLAGEKVYVADSNEDAKTTAELYPVENKVKDIHIESTYDGRKLHTFSQSSKDRFLKEWLSLKLNNRNKMKFEGEQIFLRIELENGVSFRVVFWLDTNTFTYGAVGNNEIQQIIKTETLSKP